VGRGVHEGLGSSPVFADGFGRAGPSRGVALCYRSSAIHGRSLRMKPPPDILPATCRRVNHRRLQAPPKATPRTATLCSPQIGNHTGDVYEVGSDRR
jgi:hypothetical protein